MGIIKAAFTAAGSMMEDAWKEFYYCDAMQPNQLMVRGLKRTNPDSANYGTPENVITPGSTIIVNEGQAAIVVDTGRVVAFYDTPGRHTFEPISGRKGLFKEFGERVAFGGDNVATQQRLYYFNLRESMNHRFIVRTPVTVESSGGIATVHYRLEGSYSYQIVDPEKFYRCVTGNADQGFIHRQIGSVMTSELTDALTAVVSKLGGSGIAIEQLPSHTKQLCAAVREQMANGWGAQNGITVSDILLPSVTVEGGDMGHYQKREDVAWIAGKSQTERRPSAAKPETWRCACGGENTGKFCENCGKPKPVFWRCTCGTENAGKFCENCGKPKPVSWHCNCGAENTGKFCENCGKRRPEEETNA